MASCYQPELRRVAFAGLKNASNRVFAWVSAPGVPGNQVGHASINVERWSNSNIVRAAISVALVLAMSQGLFSTFALAVVAPLTHLPMRDEDGVFRADMQFGVVIAGTVLSFGGVVCGVMLFTSLPDGVLLKTLGCTSVITLLCSAGAPHPPYACVRLALESC